MGRSLLCPCLSQGAILTTMLATRNFSGETLFSREDQCHFALPLSLWPLPSAHSWPPGLPPGAASGHRHFCLLSVGSVSCARHVRVCAACRPACTRVHPGVCPAAHGLPVSSGLSAVLCAGGSRGLGAACCTGVAGGERSLGALPETPAPQQPSRGFSVVRHRVCERLWPSLVVSLLLAPPSCSLL